MEVGKAARMRQVGLVAKEGAKEVKEIGREIGKVVKAASQAGMAVEPGAEAVVIEVVGVMMMQSGPKVQEGKETVVTRIMKVTQVKS